MAELPDPGSQAPAQPAEPLNIERPRRLFHGFSIILVGIIGIGLIILMCIAVAALAYLRS